MPYKQGYSVLPRLLNLEDRHVFQRDDDYEYFMSEKRLAVQNQQCFFESDITNEIYDRVCDFIISQAAWVQPSDFSGLAVQLQEDIAIHRINNDRDWLAACHICFPSGWRPEEKIGRPLSEIHEPIPGMNLGASFKLAKLMACKGPFYRYVWSPVFEPYGLQRINYHPNTPKAKFDLQRPFLSLKIEKQITWGFPDLEAAVFVLRQSLLPIKELDLPALYKSLSDMTSAEKKYKGVTDDLLFWLQDYK